MNRFIIITAAVLSLPVSLNAKDTFQPRVSVHGNISDDKNIWDNDPGTYAVIESGVGKRRFYFELPSPAVIRGLNFLWNREDAPDSYTVSYGMALTDMKRLTGAELHNEKNGSYYHDMFTFPAIIVKYLRVTVYRSPPEKKVYLAELNLIKDDDFVFNIIGLKQDVISDTFADISFGINYPVPVTVAYGESPKLLDKRVFAGATQSSRHRYNVHLPGLKPGTLYYLAIKFTDFNNKKVTTDIFRFETTGIPVPKFQDIKVRLLEKNDASLTVVTNTPVKAELTYHLKNYPDKALILRTNNFDTVTVFHLKNLKPNEIVKYTVVLTNKKGITRGSGFKFFGTEETNLALHKPVTGTFNERVDDRNATRAACLECRLTDGSLDFFGGMAQSGDPRKFSQWVTIDLQKFYTLEAVVVYWRSLAYSKYYSIETSRDNKNWKMVKRNINPDKEGIKTRTPGGAPMIVTATLLNNDSARYVRLKHKRGNTFHQKRKGMNYLQIFEIKVLPAFKE